MKTILLTLSVLFASFAGFGHASSNDRIVAVVNDQIITLSELQARTQLSARMMGLGAVDARQTAALQRRTLTELVDEALQMQFAASNGLTLTRAEFQEAKDNTIGTIGQKQWATITKGLAQTADAKLRGEATWERIMSAAVRPRVQLGTLGIDRLIEEMSKTQNRTEKNLSLIFVPVLAGNAADSSITLTTADPAARILELRTEATASGATQETFTTLAKTNSAAPSAKDGGNLGWMTVNEIPPAVAQAIQGLAEGEVSQPLRSPDGWLLVRVNGIRTDDAALNMEPRTEFNLYLMAVKRPSDTESVKAMEKQLATLAKRMPDLAAVQANLRTSETLAIAPGSAPLGWVPVQALQPDVAKAVRNAKLGTWTYLLEAPHQLSRIFVADTRQIMPPEVLALRKRVGDNLMAQRTELEARRFMRELRQRAFVDIRL